MVWSKDGWVVWNTSKASNTNEKKMMIIDSQMFFFWNILVTR
jgi:hypothetical protein